MKYTYDDKRNTVMGHFDIDDTSDPLAAALVANFDPFHDTPINQLKGLPTFTPVRSLVQRVRQTVNIAKDGGLAAGNWDCLVLANPFLFYNSNGSSGTLVNTFTQMDDSGHITPAVHTITATTGAWSGVSVQQKLSSSAASIRGTAGLQSVQPPINILQQNLFRIVGCGYEVTNTTANINKQGSVSVFSLSSDPHKSDIALCNAAGVPSAGHKFTLPVYNVNDPPDTLEEVSVIPNAKTWPAEEGCYVIQKFNNPTQDFKTLGRNTILVGGGQSLAASAIGGPVASYTHATDILTMNSTVDKSSLVFDMNYAGSYFSGLSETTTLTLTVMWYIEIIPKPDNSSLISLTSPGAPYSAEYADLYSRISLHMPAGVPVSWNQSFKWFKDLVKIARTPVNIGRTLGHMFAPKQTDRIEGLIKDGTDLYKMGVNAGKKKGKAKAK